MSDAQLSEFVTTLRARGVRFRADGVQLHVEAPWGVVTPEVRESIRSAKPAILEIVCAEHPELAMPLSQFAREGRPIHLEVPGFAETIWFVPGDADVRRLEARGVRRGLIWKASELIDLAQIPELDHATAMSVARVKDAFDATVLDVTVATVSAGRGNGDA